MTDPVILGQLVLNGLLLAGVYALMALGLNLIFGVIRVLNMAHGEVLMLGGFGAFWVWRVAALNPLLAVVILLPVFFALGYLFQYWIVRRLAEARPTGSIRIALEDSSLLLTYGLSLVLVALARELWTSDYRSVPFMRGSWLVGDFLFSYSQVVAFLAAAAIMLALIGLLHRTRLGMAIRATAQDPDLAAACGVEARHVHAVAFGIGTAVSAAAGMMLSTMFTVYPEMGLDYSIRAFVIVILGGLGSMAGVFIGAIVLGLAENVGAFAIGTLPATIIPFVMILIIMILRPMGIVGARQRQG